MWIGRRDWTNLNRNIGELVHVVQRNSQILFQNTQGVNRMSQAMDDFKAEITILAAAVNAEIAGLNDEITKLKMQGPSGTPEDTAGIEAGVANIKALVDQLTGATPAAPVTPAPVAPASPAASPAAPAPTPAAAPGAPAATPGSAA